MGLQRKYIHIYVKKVIKFIYDKKFLKFFENVSRETFTNKKFVV